MSNVKRKKLTREQKTKRNIKKAAGRQRRAEQRGRIEQAVKHEELRGRAAAAGLVIAQPGDLANLPPAGPDPLR